MSTVKVIEVSADSGKSFGDALESGLARAAETIEAIRSAWVQPATVSPPRIGSTSPLM